MKKNYRRRATGRVFRSIQFINYQPLEARQLLAGDFVGPHQVATSLPADTNLIVNGDFESLSGGSDVFYDEADVSGWSIVGAGSGAEMQLYDYTDYGNILDLDSTIANYDRVFQNVDTESGQQYLLAFDFRAHPNDNLNPTDRTNDFEVWWNGVWAATYTAGDIWQTAALNVAGGSGDTTELMFREISEGDFGGGDGMGALLDNVRLVAVTASSVQNGSFESPVASQTGLVQSSNITGWSASGPTDSDALLKIQTSTGSNDVRENATVGSQFLNLDTAANHRDYVFQDLDTVAGAAYFVMFDLRRDGAQDNLSDELRVRWNDAWAATLHAGDDWQSQGLLLTASSSTTRLMFLEPGDGLNDDGSGPLIDNVRMFRVDPFDPVAANKAPTIQQVADQSTDFGEFKLYSVLASDPESQPLTYSVSHSGIGLNHNVPTISSTGVVSWTPSHSGPVALTVTATDSLGKSSSMTFNVNVGSFVPGAGTHALSAVPPELRDKIYGTTQPAMKIDTTKNYEAVIDTTAGVMTIQLYADLSPVTVNNFVVLAEDGFYDGVEFHRVLEDFVAQSGDPLGTGRGGPGYIFDNETSNGLTFDKPGLLAMANSGPNTNGSQFFLTYGTPASLNGSYSIFGELVGDVTVFENAIPITHDPPVVFNGPEIPRPGVVKTKINSITINVT